MKKSLPFLFGEFHGVVQWNFTQSNFIEPCLEQAFAHTGNIISKQNPFQMIVLMLNDSCTDA